MEDAKAKLLESGGQKAKKIRAVAKEITKEANVSMALVDALGETFMWNDRNLHRAMLLCLQCVRNMIQRGGITLTIENVKKELKDLKNIKKLIRRTFVEGSTALDNIDMKQVSEHAIKDQLSVFFYGGGHGGQKKAR